MRRSRFTEGEIVHLLGTAENGVPMPEICRIAGVSPRTFYRWKLRFGGLPLEAVARMKELEAENRRLKTLVAHLAARLAAQSDADTRSVRPQHPPALRSDVGSDDADPSMIAFRKPVATVVGRFANLRTGR
jgi:putative transposase